MLCEGEGLLAVDSEMRFVGGSGKCAQYPLVFFEIFAAEAASVIVHLASPSATQTIVNHAQS